MTTFYVSTSGDNTDGLTWLTAFNEIITALNSLTGIQDDTVILDDEEHKQTATLGTDGGTKTGGEITLQSRSNDYHTCSISGITATPSGNFYLLINNEITTGNPSLKVKGITFRDHTRNDSLPIILSSNTSDLSLENCACINLRVVATATNTNGIIRQSGLTSSNLTIAGLTVRDCSVNSITSTGSNEGSLFSSANSGASTGTFSDIAVDGFSSVSLFNAPLNGLCFYKGPQTWSGTNEFKNISISAGDDSYGLIKINTTTGYNHSITGSMLIDNTNTQIISTDTNYGLINVSSSDTLSIDAVFEAKNCTNIVGSSDYGIIVNINQLASLSISGDISIHDNESNKGSGYITTIGGDLFLHNAEFYNNVCTTGGAISIQTISSTVEIYNCLFRDNTAREGGGAIAIGVLSTLNTFTLHNSTFYNNSTLAPNTGDGVYVFAFAAQSVLNIDNCIFWNKANNDEIFVLSIADFDLNISNSDILGGAAAVTGADTYVNNIESDPEFNSDLTLSRYSPCVGIGIKWWPASSPNPQDMNGNYFWDAYVDIGAFSTWNGISRRVPAPPRLPAPRYPIS